MTSSKVHASDWIFDADGVRKLDALAIDNSTSGFDLMQRAGSFAFERLRRRWPMARHIAVLCGSGNNGGDGYIVARLAQEHGLEVRLVVSAEAKTEAAREAARRCPLSAVTSDKLFDAKVDVVVDALLGNGLESAPRGSALHLIEVVAELQKVWQCEVLAVDVPSGLNSSSGNAPGAVVKAAETCTFIGMKFGLLTGRGPALAGDVSFYDCEVPPDIYRHVPFVARRLEPAAALVESIARDADWHKGQSGRVTIVGSNTGYAGAARLSAEAALRSGAGLVTVATRAEHYPAIIAGCYELMCQVIDDGNSVASLLEGADVVAIGPGLGRDRWASTQLDAVCMSDLPKVLDADALNLLAESPRRLNNAVMTPHPGEAARLLGTSIATVQADRQAAAKTLFERFGATVVLKGAGSLVVSGSDQTWVCTHGHEGMATAGMGDVLTGVIASLIAQGADVVSAARLGVLLHARAAEDAGTDGKIGILASDLLQPLRRRRNSLINKV